MQVKPEAREEALRRLLGAASAEQPALEKPPEPPPDLASDELYELLVGLKLRGFTLTAAEDILVVRPKSALASEELELLKKYKPQAISWIVGMEDHQRLRLQIKAALEEWFAEDENARVWARALPIRGEEYVAAQLWQVVEELTDRGVVVKDEEREVLAMVLMEVVGELKESAA